MIQGIWPPIYPPPHLPASAWLPISPPPPPMTHGATNIALSLCYMPLVLQESYVLVGRENDQPPRRILGMVQESNVLAKARLLLEGGAIFPPPPAGAGAKKSERKVDAGITSPEFASELRAAQREKHSTTEVEEFWVEVIEEVGRIEAEKKAAEEVAKQGCAGRAGEAGGVVGARGGSTSTNAPSSGGTSVGAGSAGGAVPAPNKSSVHPEDTSAAGAMAAEAADVSQDPAAKGVASRPSTAGFPPTSRGIISTFGPHQGPPAPGNINCVAGGAGGAKIFAPPFAAPLRTGPLPFGGVPSRSKFPDFWIDPAKKAWAFIDLNGEVQCPYSSAQMIVWSNLKWLDDMVQVAILPEHNFGRPPIFRPLRLLYPHGNYFCQRPKFV